MIFRKQKKWIYQSWPHLNKRLIKRGHKLTSHDNSFLICGHNVFFHMSRDRLFSKANFIDRFFFCNLMYTQFGNIFTLMAKWLYSLIGNQTKCDGFITCNIFLEWSYFISVKLFNFDETVIEAKVFVVVEVMSKVGDGCIN